MLKMMEKYTNNLEEVIGERTRQLEDEKKKADLLLYRMLPALVAASRSDETYFHDSFKQISLDDL